MTEWLRNAILHVAGWFPQDSWLAYPHNVRALIAIAIVSIICGSVGSLVVGNRMSFFSDALAHCAFAGITLGFIVALIVGAHPESILIPIVMLTFGVIVGVAIAYVRERTGLANDTIIGVFFAFAVGFGGMLFGALQQRTLNPESFLFGSLLFVYEADILALIILGLVLALVMERRYNQFVLASFSPSLARSRQVPIRWCNYLFIILLALIVNLCLRAVGALLINAMLVVPAATAANLCRNLRQMFWCSVLLSVAAGVSGLWISNTARLNLGRGQELEFAPAGTIVVLSVILFFISVAWKSLRDRPPQLAAALVAGGRPPENVSSIGEPPLPSGA
jgi:zinc transport system permease protein